MPVRGDVVVSGLDDTLLPLCCPPTPETPGNDLQRSFTNGLFNIRSDSAYVVAVRRHRSRMVLRETAFSFRIVMIGKRLYLYQLTIISNAIDS